MNRFASLCALGAGLLLTPLLQGQDPETDELRRRLDALEQELESFQLGGAAGVRAGSVDVAGLGPAAAKVYGATQGLSLGGYGEFVYQNFAAKRDDDAPSGKTDTFDLLRAVFYVGYKFDEQWVFNSELEFEHATTSGGRGSVSAEFAYLDYLASEDFAVRAGLVLIPMGFLNEIHEPTTFLSANRPLLENRIIPTTWRENGVGVYGSCGDFSYRSYVVNGFDASGFSASGLRGGRQKGGQAKAEDFAWVGRLDWEGVPGLLVGGSAYYGGSGQGLSTPGNDPVEVGTAIWEAHAEYRSGGWRFRGLYAMANLNQVDRLNGAMSTPLVGAASVGEELEGWYLEAGFDVMTLGEGSTQSLTPFVRYEDVNTQAGVPVGFSANPANDFNVTTVGLAWQPQDSIVFKADWQNFDDAAGTGIDQFNLSGGWIF